MKKVINGKMYNTETAKHLGNWWNYLGWRDFNNLAQDLYIKRTGEYFLHSEGGALTFCARRVGQNEWAAGEVIEPS